MIISLPSSIILNGLVHSAQTQQHAGQRKRRGLGQGPGLRYGLLVCPSLPFVQQVAFSCTIMGLVWYSKNDRFCAECGSSMLNCTIQPHNLEIAWLYCAFSRLHGLLVQTRDWYANSGFCYAIKIANIVYTQYTYIVYMYMYFDILTLMIH